MRLTTTQLFLIVLAALTLGGLMIWGISTLYSRRGGDDKPPSPRPPTPKSKGNYSCNRSGLCVLDTAHGTMSYKECVDSCQGKRSPDPVSSKSIQNCKSPDGSTMAGPHQATLEGCKAFNSECCFNPVVTDSAGNTAWCYQPAEGDKCSTFLATNCTGCGVNCGDPKVCAQKSDCCFDYNALNSDYNQLPAWCHQKEDGQMTCRDRYPARTAPETYYSFQRVIEIGGVVPPVSSQMDSVPGSMLDDGVTPIYKNRDGRYLVDWDCSSGMLCGNSWGKPSDQAKVFINLLALDSNNAIIRNKYHRIAYITSQFYASGVTDAKDAVPADNNGWQQEMVLEGPGMKSDPNTGYGCLGGGKTDENDSCQPLNVWEGGKMMYNAGLMVFSGSLFGSNNETLYGHYGSTYGYCSLSLILTESSGVLRTNDSLPSEDTGFVLAENRQNPNQTMHARVLNQLLYYSNSNSTLGQQLLAALQYIYSLPGNKYGEIGKGDLMNGYSYTLGYSTVSGERKLSATVVVQNDALVLSQDSEPGYFYGSGTKPVTAMMIINALSENMSHLSGLDFVKKIKGVGSKIYAGQGALTLGDALKLGPDKYYEVLKDQPKSVKEWINIFFSQDGCKYHGLTQNPCPSNICNTVSNTTSCVSCSCLIPTLNSDVLQKNLSIYDLTCMRGGIPDVDTNTMNPFAKGTELMLTRFRPAPQEIAALGLKGDWPDDTLEQWAVRSHAIGPLEYVFETVGLDWMPGWTGNSPNTPNMSNPGVPPASYTSSGFSLLGSLLWVLASEGGGDWLSIDLNKLYLPLGLQGSINFAGTSGNGGTAYIRRKGT